ILIKSHLHTVHPQAFFIAPQLKSVKLSSNDLSTLPPRDLDLSRNKLRSLDPDLFEGLTNLTFLNLGRNFIKKLPPTIFHSLTKLQQLILYYNELEFLEAGIFDKLINLVELKLHQNQIASLPPKVFWPLGNLKNLTLSSNQLQAIPEKNIFVSLPALMNLTLSGNPWDCNCAIRGIARWMRHNEHVLWDRDDVMCHTPIYQLLRTVGSLHDEEFSFCSATTAKTAVIVYIFIFLHTFLYSSILCILLYSYFIFNFNLYILSYSFPVKFTLHSNLCCTVISFLTLIYILFLPS
uniref:Platelet glycoprotein V-like n=1 Tax=Maylandia zebra TaxID=106582 RepID=A0A3P9AZF0_9CICH